MNVATLPAPAALSVDRVTPEAPRAAREHVRAVLAEAGASRGQIDAAELVASELVTNVLRHVGGRVLLDVEVLADTRVILRCIDDSRIAPTMRVVGAAAEGGRGLALVRALSESVSVSPVPEGKAVVVTLPGVAR